MGEGPRRGLGSRRDAYRCEAAKMKTSCLKNIAKGVVEFFGALFGIESILDRPRRDYRERPPTVDDLSTRY